MFDLVLTMAGRGQRFVDAGYRQPKAAIPALGKPLLWWSLLSVAHLLDERSETVFVVRSADRVEDLVRTVCAEHQIRRPRLVAVDETTDGQASTALMGVSALSFQRPFMVFNSDTYLKNHCLIPPQFGDAWVPFFTAQGTNWSFVSTNSQGVVLDVAEKTRISSQATVGLYSFPSASAYTVLYNQSYRLDNRLEVNGERYVAPMYRTAIGEGWRIIATEVSQSDVVPLGTPSELLRFDPTSLP